MKGQSLRAAEAPIGHRAPADTVDEGLSGLGLAFASAGAGALMLPYWDVEPSSTRTIIKGVFDQMASDPKLTLSQALNQKAAELRSKKYQIQLKATLRVSDDARTGLLRRRER